MVTDKIIKNIDSFISDLNKAGFSVQTQSGNKRITNKLEVFVFDYYYVYSACGKLKTYVLEPIANVTETKYHDKIQYELEIDETEALKMKEHRITEFLDIVKNNIIEEKW